MSAALPEVEVVESTKDISEVIKMYFYTFDSSPPEINFEEDDESYMNRLKGTIIRAITS